MAEELKGQLSEALPGATQAFAKALGLTEKQLFDKMKNGDVKASDALLSLLKNLVHRLIPEVAGKLFRTLRRRC